MSVPLAALEFDAFRAEENRRHQFKELRRLRRDLHRKCATYASANNHAMEARDRYEAALAQAARKAVAA